MFLNNCKICNKNFYSSHYKKSYCSAACKQKAYRDKKNAAVTEKSTGTVCARCFNRKNPGSIYCSNSCKTVANREKHSATFRLLKVLTGQSDYEVWSKCESDWKAAYKILQNKGYAYDIRQKQWRKPELEKKLKGFE